MKKYGKIFLVGLTILLVMFTASSLVSLEVSPEPSSKVLSQVVFRAESKITDQDSYEKQIKQVQVEKDLTYTSKFKNNTFDLYLPKNQKKITDLVIWVHGGGYVGGDKMQIEEFASRLVADTNVAFIAMNYELAPDSKYPNQVNQLNDLITYLQGNKGKYPMDMSKIFLGGDSAGAQIALQYANLASNERYANRMDFKTSIDRKDIRGTISYCGPVDLAAFVKEHGDNQIWNYLLRNISWSITGDKRWKTSQNIKEASIVENIDKDFPPTYVTDGNFYSFSDQGKALVAKLNDLGVDNKGRFFNKKELTPHEYQFNYKNKSALVCYEDTVSFINKYK
jgi:Esterase/lipase